MIKITPITFALHQEGESPVFGIDTLHLTINDDGSGPFYTVVNINPSETDGEKIGIGKLSLGMEEIKSIYKVMRVFEEQTFIDLDQ